MREVHKNLFCGNQLDAACVIRRNGEPLDGWAVVHAAKEPFHREFVGYKTPGAPKDHPEYLYAERGNRLALNMVDAPTANYFSRELFDKALEYIDNKLKEGYKVLVHCNQGESRAPSVCLLYMVKRGVLKGLSWVDCLQDFLVVYPYYKPGEGILEFLQANFDYYKPEELVE